MGDHAFSKGDLVWFDSTLGYPIPAVISGIDEDGNVSLMSDDNKETFSMANTNTLKPRKAAVSAIEDLTELEDQTESAILWNLKTRYDQDHIYTNIGSILISINPYQALNIYSTDVVHQYSQSNPPSAPHLFQLSTTVYSKMLIDNKNHIIIISGESGSGKTEANKLIMQCLATATPSLSKSWTNQRSSMTTEQILDATPILESFGNARTLRNNNSSRFGKLTEINMKRGCISGANITEYLLERSRIVMHSEGERNYHIFYEMLAGLKPEMREKFGVSEAKKYFYLNQGNCINVEGRDEKEEFKRVVAALDMLGFIPDHQHTMWRILSAILHLGNIYFTRRQISHQQEGVVVGNEAEVRWVAYLLHLDPHKLIQILTTKTTEANDEKISAPLNIDRALDIRDAIAKALYTQLFTWLVGRINKIINTAQKETCISILDIYGFEQFKLNSLEQLCINFANERLHATLVSQLFKEEQEEYAREGIKWTDHFGSSVNNQGVVDLMVKRPLGILHLLDDESNFPKGTDESFLQKCHYNHVDNRFYSKPRIANPEFQIKHYAGPVWYQVVGFLDKNRDTIKRDLLEFLRSSQNLVISQMFAREKAQNEVVKMTKGKSTMTVLGHFSDGLNELLAKASSSQPHFVRCIKPNANQLPNTFDLKLVYDQLKYLGILETIKIRKKGFPVRYMFRDFLNRYRSLVTSDMLYGRNNREKCSEMLKAQGIGQSDQFQVGLSKVFMREAFADRLDKLRQRSLRYAATTIQKHMRAYVSKKRYDRMKTATIKIQSVVRGHQARNKVTQLKESVRETATREASMLRSDRRFMNSSTVLNASQKTNDVLDPSSKTNKWANNDLPARPPPEVMGAIPKNSTDFVLTSVKQFDIPPELEQILNTVDDWADSTLGKSKVVRELAANPNPVNSSHQCTLPHDLHMHPFAKFAQGNFKGHLWQMRREPITTPFLMKENDKDFEASIQIFKLILRFMNDAELKPTQELMLANYIAQKGITNEFLRDEIYVQLVNQVHQNPKPSNTERGWLLMAICASVFPPSQELYKSLLNFVTSSPGPGFNGLRSLVQNKLQQSIHTDSCVERQLPITLLEWTSLTQRGNMALKVHFADGYPMNGQVESWTTSAELARDLLKERGISDARGWSIGMTTPKGNYAMNSHDYLLDSIAHLELPPALCSSKPPCFIAPVSSRRDATMLQEPIYPKEVIQSTGRDSVDTYSRPHRSQGEMEMSRRSALNERYIAKTPPTNHRALETPKINDHRYADEYPNGQTQPRNRLKKFKSAENIPEGMMKFSVHPSKAFQSVENVVDVQFDRNRSSQHQQNTLQPRPKPVGSSGSPRDSIPNEPYPPNSTVDRIHMSQMHATNYIPHEAVGVSVGSTIPPPPVPPYSLMVAVSGADGQPQMMQFNPRNGSVRSEGTPSNYGQYVMHNLPADSIYGASTYGARPMQVPIAVMPPGTSFVNGEPVYAAPSQFSYGSEYGMYLPNQSDYSAMSMSSRIRRVQIPSQNADVDKYLDDLFEPVLQDSALEDIYEGRSLAASIKGGGDMVTEQNVSVQQQNIPMSTNAQQPVIMMLQPGLNWNGMPSMGQYTGQHPMMMNAQSMGQPFMQPQMQFVPVQMPQFMPMQVPQQQQYASATTIAMNPTSVASQESKMEISGMSSTIVVPPEPTFSAPSPPNEPTQSDNGNRANTIKIGNIRWPPRSQTTTEIEKKTTIELGKSPIRIDEETANALNAVLSQQSGLNDETKSNGSSGDANSALIVGQLKASNAGARFTPVGQSFEPRVTSTKTEINLPAGRYSTSYDATPFTPVVRFGEPPPAPPPPPPINQNIQQLNGQQSVGHSIRDAVSRARREQSPVRKPNSDSQIREQLITPSMVTHTVKSSLYAQDRDDESILTNTQSFYEAIPAHRIQNQTRNMQNGQRVNGAPPPPPPPNPKPFSLYPKHLQETAKLQQEAMQKLRERARELPPPVDAVKVKRFGNVQNSGSSEESGRPSSSIPPTPVEPKSTMSKMTTDTESSYYERDDPTPVPPSVPPNRDGDYGRRDIDRHLYGNTDYPAGPPSIAESGSDWIPGSEIMEDIPSEMTLRRHEIVEIREPRDDSSRNVRHQLPPKFPVIDGPPPVSQRPNGHLPSIPQRPLQYDMGFYRSAAEFDPTALHSAVQDAEMHMDQIERKVLIPQHTKTKMPFYTYKDTTWNLYIRKELFLPGESMNEPGIIDLIFEQVIRDVMQVNPFRIRREERMAMVKLLDSMGIHPDRLVVDRITPLQKQTVVDMAREWPLYFAAFYPVVEKRKSEYVAQILGIHESGIRLISRTYDNADEPLRIMDYFGFEDISEVDVMGPDVLALFTHNKINVRLFTEKASQIKTLVEEFLYGPNQGRHFVRAIADYMTNEPNLLSFKRGDLIQLMPKVQEDYLGSGWLYGKINSRFGNFPQDYVEPLSSDYFMDSRSVPDGQETEVLKNESALNGFISGAEDKYGHARNGTLVPSDPKPSGKLTMMEFAMMYFRQQHPNKYGLAKTQDGTIKGTMNARTDKKAGKEWTWREIAELVKFAKNPIQSSLLKLENPEFNRLATETFIGIMQYMSDYPLKKGQSLTDVMYHVLTVCHSNPPLRDEVYCQLMKQTTNNKSSQPDSAVRGWRLMSIITAYFDCSEVLKPYLLKYLNDAATDVRRAYHGTAGVCLQNLMKTFKFGGRKYRMSRREIDATTNGKNLKRQIYHLPGGTKRVINTTAVTVVEEMIQELCGELNVLSPLEQQEFCLCYVVESENIMKLLSNDQYVLDITTELENDQKEYFILLKRTVWLHPLRLDNQLYIDVMFFQVVPDYLEGLLVIMKNAEQITASTMDDMATLAAYLHRADEHSERIVLETNSVMQILPRVVQNIRGVSPQQWCERVTTKLQELSATFSMSQARAKFLEILQRWPLFGSTFFYIMSVTDQRVQGECLLAINKHGLQFLHIVTHECLLEFRLSEVLSTHKVQASPPMGGPPMQFLDVKVGNLLQQRIISLQTEQGAEISRLLGQYIYVDSQNRGFIGHDS